MIEPRDEELSRIYRDTEGPRPPQRVDDNILAASQRIAGAGLRPAGFGFARRWGTPVAFAATVLVTGTLTLMVFERKSDLDTMVPKAPRAVRPAKVLPAEPKRADQPVTPPPEKLQPIAPAPAIPPAAVLRDQAQQRPGESPAASAPLGTGQPAFAPEVPRASEMLHKREAAKPAPAAPASDARRAFDVQQQIQLMQGPPAAAPAASPRPDSSPEIQSGGLGATGIRGTLSSANAEAGERTPEKWLEDIRKLKTEGKAIEAERELSEFKKRFPDYVVPEDLR